MTPASVKWKKEISARVSERDYSTRNLEYSSAVSSILFIQGSNGRLLLTPAYNFDEARHLTGMIGRRPFARTFKVADEFAPEIDAFAAAIIEKRSVDPDGAQGLHDMLILRAIYEWARKQQPITIEYRNEYVMPRGLLWKGRLVSFFHKRKTTDDHVKASEAQEAYKIREHL
jgi:hypothetical protein